jgi:rubrerythrin
MPTTLFASAVDFTAKNLLAAYQGEINARAKYLAFAAKADAEGLYGIASLFRAAARAEQIHANSQARVLRQMGAEAAAEVYAYKVRSTFENLKSALAGEKYEIESMYPAFIDEARAQMNSNAARSFLWSLEAEKTHSFLFQEAIDLFDKKQPSTWIGKARDFYVCPVCACTSELAETDNCAICQYPSDRLEAIR